MEADKKMIERLKELASSYVPEWKLDEENPDIGTALALVCGEMMESVEQRYQHMMEKKQIDFLNAIGGDLTPAASAKGYVSFGLSSESVEPAKVTAGTFVAAEAADAENGQITYETKDDILVSPLKLSCVYEVKEEADYIGLCYDAEEQKENAAPEEYAVINAMLFQKKAQNQQEHMLFIGHPEVFNMTGNAWFALEFYQQGNLKVQEELLRYFLDPDITEIAYYTREGFVPFSKMELEEGFLKLYREKKDLEFEKMCLSSQLEENYFIRIKIKDIEKLKHLYFQKIQVSAYTSDIVPQFIIADGQESDMHQYLPFGERLSVFNEVYFASDEILKKRGSKIELAYYLSFVSIPLETSQEESKMKWEWVMKPEDLEKKEYEISIGSVTWEYYNGTGWARLPIDHKYDTAFTPAEEANGQFKKLSFTCPMDIEKAFIGPYEAYAIRARITKLKNPYKLNGNYISPVLEHTRFSCDYSQHPVEKLHVTAYNNRSFARWKEGNCIPFRKAQGCRDSLYLGLDIPPKGGPTKVYFQLREAIGRLEANLAWEYWNGTGFVPLHVVDETNNFSKSGLVTFLGPENFQKKACFGQEKYWIRIVDVNGFYERIGCPLPGPFLEAVVPNTVKIENRGFLQTEYFQMEYFLKNKRFKLQKNSIQAVRVYVKDAVIGQADPDWKEWTMVSDFLQSDKNSEHFILNQNDGYIEFGNGSNGKVPPVSREDNIKVLYQCGGGAYTNVEKGKVNKLTKSIGFISKVYNVEPMSGGIDKETKEHAIIRCSNKNRLHNRAVTRSDYESIAYEASRRIEKARCFIGINGEGKTLHGAVTLVLLLKDYRLGSSVFQGVGNAVKAYLKGKMPDTVYYAGKLFIVEPVFITFEVNTVLRVDDFQSVFAVQNQAEEKLNSFLDPVMGNVDHKGWEMGTLPNMMQIRNLLHMTKHVEEVQSLFITVYRLGSNGIEEVDLEEMRKNPFVVPTSGTHQISIQF
ncbi:baseplate J/gp47 family protein [[Clostridium] polysaccharolyticum]|uniref:Putative baseplate assembly protein n=1 Tax=[Clostridium] polysaccharolyticum TaxID=29364 RepID=A0A1I0C9W2_9FIRM|nr:baseplate J/gp47 family protein [[Clostridium] polysaccharolyticum]SET16260.1 putative baseplate assembly protein [[Clostridium] polysaccharolyticum]